MIFYLSLAIISSALMALGLVMMKSRSGILPVAAGANTLRAIVAWIRDPMWSVGLAVQTAGWSLYVVAVSRSAVSMVAVMMQGGIALFVVASVVILGERARAREWLGIGAIVFGMVMLALSLSVGDTQAAMQPRALLTFSAVSMAAGLTPMLVERLRQSGAGLAILSGVAFGLGAVFTKAMTEAFISDTAGAIAIRIVSNPYAYCMIFLNIAGIVMLQNSFHSARGIIAMPLSGAISNVVPIVGGMVAFGERLPADPVGASMRVGAFVLTVIAGALLAASREQQPTDSVASPILARSN
jgi:uncharacterized membrane protein